MAVFIINSSELRFKTTHLVRDSRAGDSFVILHYKDVVGHISPEVPEKVLKKIAKKEKGEGFKRLD